MRKIVFINLVLLAVLDGALFLRGHWCLGLLLLAALAYLPFSPEGRQ